MSKKIPLKYETSKGKKATNGIKDLGLKIFPKDRECTTKK